MRGQRVSARDRLYLLSSLPTLVVWGDRDRTIPVEHGLRAHAEAPASRFATVRSSGHFPNLERPTELAGVLREFLQTTTPARLDAGAWSELLASRPGARG
jgi:pimeloyl-ACP methyl ester carboxylesterase